MAHPAHIIPLMRLLAAEGGQTAAQLAARLRRRPEWALTRLQFLQTFFGAAAERGGAWRLSFSPQWLDCDFLKTALPGAEVAEETESANSLAKNRKRGAFIFAEHQTRGRGRRGRRWLAMPGGSIMLSARLAAPPKLSGLSLAVGAALWRALGGGLRLKWPNDLWNGEGQKVGGVLIETDGDDVIIGAGVNLVMTPELRAHAPRAAALDSPLSRNACAARAGAAVLQAAGDFRRNGLDGFWEDIHAAHYFRAGAEVSFAAADGAVRGTFAGFGEDGALLIRQGGGVQSYVSGDLAHVAGG
ncbi:MAG: biotin--[acetyl-CoA-carboxylase] ligase [Gammaproteobacteria bacterium]